MRATQWHLQVLAPVEVEGKQQEAFFEQRKLFFFRNLYPLSQLTLKLLALTHSDFQATSRNFRMLSFFLFLIILGPVRFRGPDQPLDGLDCLPGSVIFFFIQGTTYSSLNQLMLCASASALRRDRHSVNFAVKVIYWGQTWYKLLELRKIGKKWLRKRGRKI